MPVKGGMKSNLDVKKMAKPVHEPSEIEKHEAKARTDHKAYYRDERADWADRAEPGALKHEGLAREARMRNDETTAQQHDALATRFRVLIRN